MYVCIKFYYTCEKFDILSSFYLERFLAEILI